MRALRNISAYLLLLLFMRVMVPEKALVMLHAHAHTVHTNHDERTLHIDVKHTHCPTAELFDAPFQLSDHRVYFAAPTAWIDNYLSGYACIWKFSYPQTAPSRGPPALV
ncbi:hypothetical protein GU926_11910 [Nibribacter ruber]|uniref:Uncharacterized protein n=1 Tax=Nibribacter ruber TaxID=2698458 RepID=A0A6P1P0X1_9BACT|nr:hypothetical protein [Nibribacter ruber]QHL88098.1 hypothetical protein GU926_11910 [Nibribacter ruber]